MAQPSSSDLGTSDASHSPRLALTKRVHDQANGSGHEAKRTKSDLTAHFAEQNRQWDLRINLDKELCSLDSAEHELAAFCKRLKDWPAVRYAFVGGIELGENPAQDDYEKLHAHIALILHTPLSRRNVTYKLSLDKFIQGPLAGESRSHYISARNPFASFKGWISHHSKEQTKVGAAYTALEFGDPPKQYANQLIEAGKPQKVKQDDMLREVIQLFEQGKKEQAFQEYPSLTLRYHAGITAFVKTRLARPQEIDHTPRLWIHGPPGTGKSAYIAWKYPRAFKKSLAKNEILYWNGLDLDWHTAVYLEDIGPDAFRDLGLEQLKQWSDASHGYTIAMKYGAPIHGVTLPLVVTSNYTPAELFPHDQKYPLTEKQALLRRFEVIHIQDLLRREGIALKSKEELKALKVKKNADFGAVFTVLPRSPRPNNDPEPEQHQ